MEYKVIIGYGEDDINFTVNRELKRGWSLSGGTSITVIGREYEDPLQVFCQAMIRE